MDWGNSPYKLPSEIGPRPRKDPEPSFFDVQENEKLTQEVKELKHEVEHLQNEHETLSQRPSHHEQKLATRRETYNKCTISSLHKERYDLEDKLDSAAAKKQKLTSKIKKLDKDLFKSEN